MSYIKQTHWRGKRNSQILRPFLANNEGARRDMWKQRIRALADEAHVLRTAFTRAQRTNPHSS